MKYTIIILIAFAVFSQATNAPSQERNTPTLKSLTFKLDVQRAEMSKPITELQEKYDKALERIEIGEQEKGNLKEVIGIREERKQFRERVKSPNTVQALPIFKKLRDIYVRESGKMRSAIAIREVELLKTYAANLEAMAKELTRKGELEEALKVSKIAETAREDLATSKKGSGIGVKVEKESESPSSPVVGVWMKVDTKTKFEFREDGTLVSPKARNSRYLSGKWTLRGKTLTLIFPGEEKKLRLVDDDFLQGEWSFTKVK